MNVRYVRWAILGLLLICSMILNYLHITSGAMYPSVHAICPLGGLENLQVWLSGHANIQKLFSGTMTLFFVSVGFTFLFGRTICGNICPLGALMEFVGALSPVKFPVSKKADMILRYLKYIILAIVTGMAWITASLWISPYDPYVAYAHIWSLIDMPGENIIGLFILVMVLMVSLFIERFFCRYLCPAGALFAIFSSFSPTRISRSSCSECGTCSRSCPMGIEPGRKEPINRAECIQCATCVNVCPSQKQVISTTIAGRQIQPLAFIIGTVCIFFGILFLLHTAGLMQVTVPPVESISQGEIHMNLIDLRGSMTIEEGSIYSGMNLTEFYTIMEIPERVPADTLLKQVQDYVPGYDFHAMKAR